MRDSILIITVALALLFIGFMLGVLTESINSESRFDRRASNLGLKEYNAKADKMIYKSNVKCDKWTFYYLKYGTMKIK